MSTRYGFRNKQRVQFTSFDGKVKDWHPTGTVIREYTSGVRVRWDDGRIEMTHPDHLRVIKHSRTRTD